VARDIHQQLGKPVGIPQNRGESVVSLRYANGLKRFHFTMPTRGYMDPSENTAPIKEVGNVFGLNSLPLVIEVTVVHKQFIRKL
jgi:hypothetical protein